MEKLNNVQKAIEIAKSHEVIYDRFLGETSNDECFLSALEMAEWKDKHPSSETIKRILKVALTRTNIALADNLDDVDYDELIELANKTKEKETEKIYKTYNLTRREEDGREKKPCPHVPFYIGTEHCRTCRYFVSHDHVYRTIKCTYPNPVPDIFLEAFKNKMD